MNRGGVNRREWGGGSGGGATPILPPQVAKTTVHGVS